MPVQFVLAYILQHEDNSKSYITRDLALYMNKSKHKANIHPK